MERQMYRLDANNPMNLTLGMGKNLYRLWYTETQNEKKQRNFNRKLHNNNECTKIITQINKIANIMLSSEFPNQ